MRVSEEKCAGNTHDFGRSVGYLQLASGLPFCIVLLDWCVHVGSISSCWFPGAMGVCFVTQPAAAPSAIGPKWCPLPLWQWH